MSSPSNAANRLALESSPYLRLHAHNPVDWYPWGEEALARARAEDKPIFLSVGYSTCYWCHVMERESFSDPAVAAEMNRRFVNIKVDREERPDLDEIYMLATQILSGQGGWPNSVFLTPSLEPFFAGTYFPPEDGHGRPGFRTVIESLDHAWRERRADVDAQASELGAAIRKHLDEIEPHTGALPGAELLAAATAGLRQRFDPTWGGFGQQPKFPTPSNLWLLEELLDPALAKGTEAAAASMMLDATLDQMARGGLRDQLAGGFHRYATDREWKVPHFEKMLYDNGLLLELYARAAQRTGSQELRRVTLETAGWLEREMSAPEGGFWSALDAETDGHEGAYFVWTRAELDAALGEEDAEFAAALLGFADEPFFEQSAYVLHLPRSLDVQARQRRTTYAALRAELDPLRAKLLAARDRRKRPATDDKLLADWNGTAIAGLAEAGRCLNEPTLIARAERAARFVTGTMRAPDGTLLHAWRAGSGTVRAFLSDYVFLIRGLLALHRATHGRSWLDAATSLQSEQERRLESPNGGFFNAEERPDLISRSKELFDGAMPAANAVAVLNLLDLHAATQDAAHLATAERSLRAFAPIVATHPDGARTMTIAFSRFAHATGGGDLKPPTDQEPLARGESGGAATEAATPGLSPSKESFPPLSATFATPPELHLQPLPEAGLHEFDFRFELHPGWHLSLVPERSVPALGVEGGEIVEMEWPEARSFALGAGDDPAEEPLRGFAGRVEVSGRIRFDTPRPRVLFRFEACGDGRCLPVRELVLALG